jgi:hypothetical protein
VLRRNTPSERSVVLLKFSWIQLGILEMALPCFSALVASRDDSLSPAAASEGEFDV